MAFCVTLVEEVQNSAFVFHFASKGHFMDRVHGRYNQESIAIACERPDSPCPGSNPMSSRRHQVLFSAYFRYAFVIKLPVFPVAQRH